MADVDKLVTLYRGDEERTVPVWAVEFKKALGWATKSEAKKSAEKES